MKKIALILLVCILATLYIPAKTLMIPVTITTYISSKTKNKNYGKNPQHLMLGMAGKHKYAAYLGGIPTAIIPGDAKITKATLVLTSKSKTQNKQARILVYSILSNWTAEEITYSRQPELDSVTSASFYINEPWYYTELADGVRYYIDITIIFQNWITENKSRGIALIPADEKGLVNKFYTTEESGDFSPYIDVEIE